MAGYEYLIAITIFYGFILFLDRFFKSCSMYPYIAFLNGTGLNVGVLRIFWKTTAFNRTLLKMGTKYKRFFNIWFDGGLYSTLILLPISIGVLCMAVIQLFMISSTNSKVHREPILNPIIPGITSPLDEIGYYAIALGIASTVHELGHALAAVREDIHITSIGFKIFFIFPLAFVEIQSDQLISLNVWKKLRVLCAGIWHNLVIAGIGYAFLSVLPFLFSPFYSFNNGVRITEITPNSPLLEARGLHVGDIIIGLNEFKIKDDTSWYDSLAKTITSKPGYCVETDFVQNLDESVLTRHESNGIVECCDKSQTQNLCFEYIADGVVQLPPHMCLPVRKIIEHSKTLCYSETCSLDLHCIKPVLPNATSLLSIQRIKKNDVIYIGHPVDVYRTVKVSPFVPKTFFLNSEFADKVTLLLIYIIVFSLGVAVVNVIPCWYLDGQHIIVSLIHLILVNRVKSKLFIDMIAVGFTSVGTLLLVVGVSGTLWTKLFH